MTDQTTIDRVRNENYPLKIYQASGNRSQSVEISTELIKRIEEYLK